MLSLTRDEIDGLITGIESKNRSSELGFFSKPVRVYRGDKAYIVKLYLPVRNYPFINFIVKNHEDYITELKRAGLNIPETVILTRQKGKKHQLVIIQDSFRDEDLVRNLITEAGKEKLTDLISMLFTDVINFNRRKKNSIATGFHPTLRNYAYHEGKLWFFDTFPPMLMEQRELNGVILRMSPYGGWLRKIIPLLLINKVSDEYYQFDKMFTGIVGSCCRLRPADAGLILNFSREYVAGSEQLTNAEKESILRMVNKPPRLSQLWILIRKLSGNTGKPNISTPTFS
ncbi:MAG: hypothetical protein IQL11_09260 [Bacteroidales bacterium]|nr:hypothetical protein [Bacteroidales bacterium]